MNHRDHSHSQRFRCKDGRAVSILLDDSGYRIAAYADDDGKLSEIGRIELDVYEDEFSGSRYWLITYAFLDGLDRSYLRQGIGRRMLELHRSVFGEMICAGQHDGQTREDGSHLTGNAPAWVAQMRAEKLIFDDVDRGFDDDDDRY